jgi:D-inositol-3-phosphate glycosyltransferase
MKILMVDSLVGNDYAIALCTSLANNGADVQLVVPKGRKVDKSVPFSVIHLGPSKDPSINKIKKIVQYINYLRQLLALIYKSKVEIVHFQFLRLEGIESLFLSFLKILSPAVVYTAHNVLPHENRKLDFVFKRIIYWAADGIIIHSRYIQEKLLKTFTVAVEKTYIIPHGNFDMYLPDTTISQEDARKRFSLSPEDNVILFFGYIRAYKGLDMLIEAFRIAATQDERLKLLIAGAPQNNILAKKYKMQIEQLEAKESVLFHAQFIPFAEVATYFSASDVVILPYKNIDHSGIVHLAYSFGKPIIASPVGDFPEAVEHGKSGYIFQEYTVESLVRIIVNAFADKENLGQMGCFAKELSDTKYSWQDVAQKTKQFYDQLTGNESNRLANALPPIFSSTTDE